MDTTTTSTGSPRTSDSFHEPPRLPPEPPAESRHHPWVWLIALVLILGAAYWMYHQYQAAQLAHQATARRGSGAVPVTTGVVQKGDIGVYVEGLGAVTPVNTVSITSRVQGQIVAVHYREGQMVHAGDPLIDIDPRPYEAQLSQVQGQMARDEATLAQARIDLDRYRAALSKNAISQQQVYDQEQSVKQFEGTVKNDQRPRRPAPGRSREYRASQQQHHSGGRHAAATHHRNLQRRRGLPPGDPEAASLGPQNDRPGSRPRRKTPRDRLAPDHRQPGRSHHWHDQDARHFRESGQHAVPQSIREREAAGRYAARSEPRSQHGPPAQRAGRLPLCHQGSDRVDRARNRGSHQRNRVCRARRASQT